MTVHGRIGRELREIEREYVRCGGERYISGSREQDEERF